MDNFAQQGWQCPICKRVYSPFTPCCFICGAEGMTNSRTSTGSTPRWTDKLSVDNDGNMRDFNGNIVGRYDFGGEENEV